MNRQLAARLVIDFAMTILLLCAFGYRITGVRRNNPKILRKIIDENKIKTCHIIKYKETFMQYIQTTLGVKNLEKSLAFYRDVLGLAVVRQGGDQGPIFLGEAEKPTIELIDSAKDPAFAGFSIGFSVDSLEEATEKMETAGFFKVQGPLSINPHLTVSLFKDPDGVNIYLSERK
jgi:catechol 2,3-dioxygenase-like lactoylglutathione lyase family enzyme